MNQPTIIFMYNVPPDLTLNNYPDVFVTVKSTLGEKGQTYSKFLELDTHLVTRVTNWLKLYVLVNKVCEQKWAEVAEPSFNAEQFAESYFSQVNTLS